MIRRLRERPGFDEAFAGAWTRVREGDLTVPHAVRAILQTAGEEPDAERHWLRSCIRLATGSPLRMIA